MRTVFDDQDPEISIPVEGWKETFTNKIASIDYSSGRPKINGQSFEYELWRWFAGNYVDVLASMHGWKHVAENAKSREEEWRAAYDRKQKELDDLKKKIKKLV